MNLCPISRGFGYLVHLQTTLQFLDQQERLFDRVVDNGKARERMAGNYILISRDKRAREVAERVITLEK